MTTRVRLSSSGKKLGPIHLGSGTSGRKWRAHGSTATHLVVTTVLVEIDGMNAISVDMRPGYLYEVDLYSTLSTNNPLTSSSSYWEVKYLKRAKATGTWDPTWTSCGTRHNFLFSPAGGGGEAHEYRQFPDLVYGISVPADVDQIKFGVEGHSLSGPSGTSTYLELNGCHVVIAEYLP